MGKVLFNDKDHTYEMDGIPLDSVSSLVASLSKPFDREGISQKLADARGVARDLILAEWDQKRLESQERGTMVHSYIEDVLGGGGQDFVTDFLNIKTPEMVAFDMAWGVMQKNLDAKVVSRECIVGDKELRMAGRYDVLVSLFAQTVRVKCLFDWKTGRFRTSNHFDKMLPPFDDQDDCEMVKYSLQLSMYRLLIERNMPEDLYGNAYIAHLRSDGSHHIHRAIDFRERLLKWLLSRDVIASRLGSS